MEGAGRGKTGARLGRLTRPPLPVLAAGWVGPHHREQYSVIPYRSGDFHYGFSDLIRLL